MNIIADKFITIAENVPKVYDAGKTAEYDRLWDNLTVNGTRKGYDYAFCGEGWNDDIFNIPLKYLPLKPTNAQYMFRGCSATVIPSVDFTNCSTLNLTYGYARDAITIGTVKLRSDGTNTLTNPFTYCDELQNITFDGVIGNSLSFGRSSKLSSESIDNIIDHLADLTGATAQTITFNSSSGTILNGNYKNEGVTRREKMTSLGWDVVS